MRNYALSVSAAAISLALVGCTVGPNYQEPKTLAPPVFTKVPTTALSPTTQQATTFTDDEPVVRWWTSFNDPTLTKLIDDSIKQNFDLKAAEANLREARELLLQSRYDQAPIVTADGGYQRQRFSRVNAYGADRNRDLYSAGFDATWELDVFGGLRRETEARNSELLRAEEQRRFVQLSITAEIARNYAELRGAQERLRIARANADNQKRTHDLSVSLLTGGRGTDLDSSRAKSQLETTLASIPAIEQSIDTTVYRLSVLAGLPPTALEAMLGDSTASLPENPQIVAIGDPLGMIRRRPDVRIVERTLAAATARIGVQTADLYPHISLNGSIGLETDRLDHLGRGSDAFGFGPRITWAAFDLGRVKSRVRAAGDAADADAATFQQTVLDVLEEIQGSLTIYGRESERLSHLVEAEKSSRHASDLARQRYENGGIGDFLTVLDAERRTLETQQELAESRTRAVVAIVAVYKALGAD